MLVGLILIGGGDDETIVVLIPSHSCLLGQL